MSSYHLIGLMSGTSMDGLDVAFCSFLRDHERWSYTLHAARTYPYPKSLLTQLHDARQLPAEALLQLDKDLGRFFGACVNQFIASEHIDTTVSAIASHGHTVFHQPDKGFTLQIGCGDTISTMTGIPVINDFRQKDVIEGGQGAPLVPIGDTLLFGHLADAFLNIGGFCNICVPGERVIAYDTSPGNLPLNHVAGKLGLAYDRDGELARNGRLHSELLETLNALPFYHALPPKSLGTEWLDSIFMPLLPDNIPPEDLLHTITEHIAIQTGLSLKTHKAVSVFISGGGARNTYLTERIQAHFSGSVVIPDSLTIDFKEAIVFGFLGALYLAGENNCLSSVTGAARDVRGGVLHLP